MTQQQFRKYEFFIDLGVTAKLQGVGEADVVRELQNNMSVGNTPFGFDGRETDVRVRYLEFADEHERAVAPTAARVKMCRVVCEGPGVQCWSNG